MPTHDRIFIEIRLPAPLTAIGELLKVISEHWPGASIDFDHPEGWAIWLDKDKEPKPT